MARLHLLALIAAGLPSALTLPSNIPVKIAVEGNQKRQYTTPEDRAQAVVDTFKLSWEGYYKYAFPNDELKPVTNGFSNSSLTDVRNKWGASAVDALSTALVMGEKEIVNQIISYIPSIDFSQTSTSVSLFETTIRYLGAMISGYDFLKGPLASLADNKADVDALLTQSINLANNLSYAFDTASGVPWNNLIFSNRSNDGSDNGLATVGTLILEWVRLADLSGNSTYATLVEKAESYLLNPSPASSEPFPGLLGMNISPLTGEFQDAVGGWIGGADSYYEYLIKMYIYDPSRYATYRDAWITAAESTIQYLTSHPTSRPDLTFVAAFDGTTLRLRSQHLACFDGGNFILAGQTLGAQQYTAYGLALVDGCHETYARTATRIGPEQFRWDPSSVPDNQTSFYNASGFYITDPSYSLRPEVMESYYYAYRATSDTKYRDWAWEAFVAVNATTRVGSGYSSIKDVNVVGGGGFTDFQESFWFAEVLKYSYLIQTGEDEEWQVGGGGRDGWVFNTEAHPVKVFGGSEKRGIV
ncbi:glycoside hydrolase [Ampelomyces quisqualis]|uniref:alpha-1,2-Mannosidase n=1 Tax=Ampelomyces quisqualis TaxID=50730 RepID=A0A6A5QTI9_AMPQU|nr:glycoside hydrolase [Ampelomyces quisqualis]